MVLKTALATALVIGGAVAFGLAPVEKPLVPLGGRSTQWELLGEYPHDAEAFTQGLAWSKGQLYESTGLKGGRSSVRKVDVETGKVTAIRNLEAHYFGEGMVVHDNTIHQLTWQYRDGMLWDADTLESTGTFKFNTSNGQGWGITSDGSELIVSDGSQYLMFWDPLTHEESRRVEVVVGGRPLRKINELEYIEGYVFANVWFDDRIYKIDPVQGNVIDVYDFSQLYPREVMRAEIKSREACLNGIAYDGEEGVLYLTGKLWPKLYKVRLKP